MQLEKLNLLLQIIVGLFVVIGSIYSFFKWILPFLKKKSQIPGPDKYLSTEAELVVYKLKHGIYDLVEVYNAGPEIILDLKVTIYWENNQGKQKRKIHEFINDGTDPLWAKPHDCNILENGEKKLIVNFPSKELKGKVKVNIKGKTHISKKEIDKNFEV